MAMGKRLYRTLRDLPVQLLDAGAVASIGRVGDSYDNALAERVIGLYKTECVRHDGPWRGVDDLELATLSWVHWFNQHRLHSMLGHVPPGEYENQYYRHHHSAGAVPVNDALESAPSLKGQFQRVVDSPGVRTRPPQNPGAVQVGLSARPLGVAG